MPPILLLLPFFGRRVVCAHTAIFSAKPVPKNAGTIHFVFRGWFGADNGLRNEHYFGRFFSSNKSEPTKRKKGFYTSRLPKNEEIRWIFVWSSKELWTLFKIQDQNLKNQKPMAVDVLFRAYPMVPLSCRSNLAGRYH